MIKPRRLKRGDKVKIVSLSSGMMGEKRFLHRYEIGMQRLADEFGLVPEPAKHALAGIRYVYDHPEKRAEDLMDAFCDSSVSAVITAIGGDDSIRLLPYVDFDAISKNPKVFMGYSDTTVNHFMMFKAGLVSFYGPSLLTDFGEYVDMLGYTKSAVLNTLFERRDEWEIEPSFGWVPKRLEWQIENVNTPKALTPETTGIEVLQGEGICEGRLLGGCVDVFPMLFGTALWPDAEAWRGAILMIETSEEELTPGLLLYFMRNMAATGVLGAINGIIVGRPYFGRNYDEYKTVLRQALREAGRENLPVLYNVNFGHSQPCSVLPIGCRAKIDCSARKLFITEPCVE